MSYLLLSLFALALAHDGDDHDHTPEPFPPRSWLQKPLMCNCTLGASKFCKPEGTCDAHLVAAQLKSGLRNAHIMMETMVGTAGHREIMDRVCSAMSKVDVVTDIQILDYDHWEPACVSISDGRQFCALAPVESEPAIDVGRLNGMISHFYEYLGCDERFPPALLKKDWAVCRDADYCNDAKPDLLGLNALFPKAGVIIPVAAALCGLLLISVVVCVFVLFVKRSRSNHYSNHVIGGKSLQV